MKRMLPLIAIATLTALGPGLFGQGSPMVGTWKMNAEKSKYTNVAMPKNETRTVEAQGSALKISFEGVAADGSKVSYSFITNLDGKPVSISGSGAPGGADMIATKRVNANATTSAYIKAGKDIFTTRTAVSKDGKVTTTTRKGTDASGKPVLAMSVWEKQ